MRVFVRCGCCCCCISTPPSLTFAASFRGEAPPPNENGDENGKGNASPPPRSVTLRNAKPGRTNAIRNEHVLPVRPNANATFGTYSERPSAASIDPSATACESRAAVAGEIFSISERKPTGARCFARASTEPPNAFAAFVLIS